MGAPLRVAIVGGGISGLVCAYLLDSRYEVTLFEASERLGGHTHTQAVPDPNGRIPVDTGFIVFNEENYPLFSRLLARLGIDSQATAMSFSVSDARSGLEWAGSPSLNTVFGQRRNLVSPRFWGMLRDIMRFGREAPAVLAESDDRRCVADFTREHGYGQAFVEHYLLPLGASLWSCPERRFAQFPIRFVVEFLQHHRMLGLGGRPQWRSIPGGSRRYIEALCTHLRARVHTATPVRAIRRRAEGVQLVTATDTPCFDEAILACHADTALGLLGDAASATERELLAAFPYQPNEAILHNDERVLPRTRRCWAAWNHAIGAAPGQVSISYNMNILQRLPAATTWCVTLNDDRRIAPERIVSRTRYDHPLYTADRGIAQARHGELIRANRTSYCGAYWGYGFHEDGVRSAVRVANAFGVPGP